MLFGADKESFQRMAFMQSKGSGPVTQFSETGGRGQPPLPDSQPHWLPSVPGRHMLQRNVFGD